MTLCDWDGVLALLNGQWISVLLAGVGIFSTILSSSIPSSNFPFMQMGVTYSLLATFILQRYIIRASRNTNCGTNFKKDNERVTTATYNSGNDKSDEEALDVTTCCIWSATGEPDIWWYMLAAVFDLLGNSLTFYSYNFTTITSIMMLDCFTIPCVMVLSYVFLNARYSKREVLGIFLCIVGLAVILVDDVVYLSNAAVAKNALLGDCMVLLSSFFIACSNVLEERLVKDEDPQYYLGNLGGFGMIFAAVLMLIFEIRSITGHHYTPKIIWACIGFIGCQFLMYVSVAFMLNISSALVFNLSLLTSDVYSVIFSYFFHGFLVSWLYFVGFGFVLVGLTVYHWSSPEQKVRRYSAIPTEDSDDAYPSKRTPI